MGDSWVTRLRICRFRTARPLGGAHVFIVIIQTVAPHLVARRIAQRSLDPELEWRGAPSADGGSLTALGPITGSDRPVAHVAELAKRETTQNWVRL